MARKKIECWECDSNYEIIFSPGSVDGQPDFCPFCGEEIIEQHQWDDSHDDEIIEIDSDWDD